MKYVTYKCWSPGWCEKDEAYEIQVSEDVYEDADDAIEKFAERAWDDSANEIGERFDVHAEDPGGNVTIREVEVSWSPDFIVWAKP